MMTIELWSTLLPGTSIRHKPTFEKHWSGIRATVRAWLRGESGASMVEFTITAPLLFLLFFVTVEYGYLKVREIALDRVTDETFRELRLGLITDANHETVKAAICSKRLAGVVLIDCADNLLLEVRSVPKSDWSIQMNANPNCLDTSPPKDYEPPIDFSPGAQNQLMIARTCLIQRPLFPPFEWTRALARYDNQGNFALFSKSAFVNEP